MTWNFAPMLAAEAESERLGREVLLHEVTVEMMKIHVPECDPYLDSSGNRLVLKKGSRELGRESESETRSDDGQRDGSHDGRRPPPASEGAQLVPGDEAEQLEHQASVSKAGKSSGV